MLELASLLYMHYAYVLYVMMITNFWFCCLLCHMSHVVKLSVSPPMTYPRHSRLLSCKNASCKTKQVTENEGHVQCWVFATKNSPDPKMCWVVIRSQATPSGTRDRWSAQISTQTCWSGWPGPGAHYYNRNHCIVDRCCIMLCVFCQHLDMDGYCPSGLWLKYHIIISYKPFERKKQKKFIMEV